MNMSPNPDSTSTPAPDSSQQSQQRRRRRVAIIAGAVVAALAIGGVTTTLVVQGVARQKEEAEVAARQAEVAAVQQLCADAAAAYHDATEKFEVSFRDGISSDAREALFDYTLPNGGMGRSYLLAREATADVPMSGQERFDAALELQLAAEHAYTPYDIVLENGCATRGEAEALTTKAATLNTATDAAITAFTELKADVEEFRVSENEFMNKLNDPQQAQEVKQAFSSLRQEYCDGTESTDPGRSSALRSWFTEFHGPSGQYAFCHKGEAFRNLWEFFF